MNKSRIWPALLLAGIATASAHSRLRTSTPADNSTVSAAPSQVVLGFSEVTQLAALTLTHGSDAPIKVAALPQKAAQQLTVAVPALVPGSWTLGWRAVGDDGHVTHGTVHFTVAPAH